MKKIIYILIIVLIIAFSVAPAISTPQIKSRYVGEYDSWRICYIKLCADNRLWLDCYEMEEF